jgi:predicted hydrolase (HD superfamily)
MERPATIALLRQCVHRDALIKYCLATGAVMKAVAVFLSEDPTHWEESGILQDIVLNMSRGTCSSTESWVPRLRKKAGIPDDICEIVTCHNHFFHGYL